MLWLDPSQHSSTDMRMSSLLLILLVDYIQAIPFVTVPYPNDFDRYGKLITMIGTSSRYINPDAVCSRFTKTWWRGYEPRRLKAQQEAPEGSLFKREFTRYPNNDPVNPTVDVPVESFEGESFVPSKMGWRTGRWGCWTACQDLQKTIEIALAYKLEGSEENKMSSIQSRAKGTFGFECPKDMISRTWKKAALREHETDAELKAGIELMLEYGATVPTPYKLEEFHLRGRTASPLSGCHCIEATEEEALEELRQRKGEAIQAIRMKRKMAKENSAEQPPEPVTRRVAKMNKYEHSKRKPKRGGLHDHEAGSSVLVNTGLSNDVEPEQEEKDPIFGDILEEDLIMPSTSITCHDYQFPDIDMDLPEIPIHEPIVYEPTPEATQDMLTFLQAYFEDYDTPNFGIAQPKDPPP